MTGHAHLGLVKSSDFTNVFLFPLPQGKKLLAGLVLSSSVGDPQLACQYACVLPPFKNHSLSPGRGLPRRLLGKTSNLPFCNGFSPVHLGNGNQGSRFTHVFVVSLPHLECELHKRQGVCRFCLLPDLACLEECLAGNRHSVNTCSVNEDPVHPQKDPQECDARPTGYWLIWRALGKTSPGFEYQSFPLVFMCP